MSAGLGRRPGLYDPEVSDGRILVGVERPAEGMVENVEALLGLTPGAVVRRQ